MIKCDNGEVKIEGESYQIMSELAYLIKKIFVGEFLTREQIDKAHDLAFMNKKEMLQELLKILAEKLGGLNIEDEND